MFSWSSWKDNALDSQSMDSDEIVQKSLEILITPSLHPLLQQKPIAFCFECLVATSPYLIPWVYNCSPSCTCPKMPLAILSYPYCLLPTVTHPTDNCLFSQWRFICFFLLHSFIIFPRVILALLYPVTLYLIPAVAPHSGLTLGTACSEHCGVLRTAWSNVDEAWEAQSGGSMPWTFCQMSL